MSTKEVEVAPSAQEVSAAFVGQYYKILELRPDAAHNFYVNASAISRPSPDGSMLSFTSVEAINEQILSWNYENTTFELLSVDSQNSLEDGIFIMVIGFLTRKDNPQRKFSQMFYLTRQEKTTYVLLNDIFHFVDDEASAPPTSPVVEFVPAPVDLNKTHNVTAVEKPVNAAHVKNVVAEATPSLENGKIKPSDEKAVAAQKPKDPVAETVAPKRTFASIVQAMANNAAPIQVKTPIQKPEQMGQPRAAAVAPQKPKEPVAETVAPKRSFASIVQAMANNATPIQVKTPIQKPKQMGPQAPAAVSNSQNNYVQKIIEEPGTSIFVSNLPMNAMAPQLYGMFKGFGPLKDDGIQVRSSRAKGTCYGFVAFEFAASVQSLLEYAKNNPFMLAGCKLSLKEKKLDYGVSKYGSADGGDEFRRNRNCKSGGRNGNGDNNQKSNEIRRTPEVKA